MRTTLFQAYLAEWRSLFLSVLFPTLHCTTKYLHPHLRAKSCFSQKFGKRCPHICYYERHIPARLSTWNNIDSTYRGWEPTFAKQSDNQKWVSTLPRFLLSHVCTNHYLIQAHIPTTHIFWHKTHTFIAHLNILYLVFFYFYIMYFYTYIVFILFFIYSPAPTITHVIP